MKVETYVGGVGLLKKIMMLLIFYLLFNRIQIKPPKSEKDCTHLFAEVYWLGIQFRAYIYFKFKQEKISLTGL